MATGSGWQRGADDNREGMATGSGWQPGGVAWAGRSSLRERGSAGRDDAGEGAEAFERDFLGAGGGRDARLGQTGLDVGGNALEA